MNLLDLDARWRRFNDPDRSCPCCGRTFSGVFDIGFDHLAGRTGQLQRVRQHRSAPLTDRGGLPVDVDLREERVVLQESAQTAPMVGESIVAIVLERHDVGDQLSLDLA